MFNDYDKNKEISFNNCVNVLVNQLFPRKHGSHQGQCSF